MSGEEDSAVPDPLLELTADIVTAYVSHNTVAPEAVPGLIEDVYKSLAAQGEAGAASREPLEPAVPVSQSVTDDHIICLEDGQPYKSLKRHLRSKYELTPAEYRAKWGLPPDYPMVAPNYAKERSRLARESGLGRRKQGYGE